MKIFKLFRCPNCHAEDLIQHLNVVKCNGCQREYSLKNEKYCFLDIVNREEKEAQATDSFVSRIKEKVKNLWPQGYPLLIEVLSPVMNNYSVKDFLATFRTEAIIFNLGSGVSDWGDKVINVDLSPYPSVDVVGNLECLPIRSNVADGILNVAVLEHVKDPYKAVSEMLRILKPGGHILAFVPFIQGEHSSPHDYRRFTKRGLQVLFGDFEIEKIRTGGPASAFVWVLQEFLAMLFSFGSMGIYRGLLIFFTILSPLKYLDSFLQYHPAASQIGTGHWVRARKPYGKNS